MGRIIVVDQKRVRAHLFICMLAYYVKWHMFEAWRPLLFADEDSAAKDHREPVRAAQRSPAADKKAQSRRLPDGSPVQSFQTLLKHLATIVRNTCRKKDALDTDTFTIDTHPSEYQLRAFELVKKIQV
jgi:hypothetical protein